MAHWWQALRGDHRVYAVAVNKLSWRMWIELES